MRVGTGTHRIPEPSPTDQSPANLLQSSEPGSGQVAAGNFSVNEAGGKGIGQQDQKTNILERDDRPNQSATHASKGKKRKHLPHSSCNPETSQSSDPVLEWFSIFHVWERIRADATEGKPEWTTVKTKYPFNASGFYESWKSDDELVGVRFANGPSGCTQYGMLDVDTGSQYHPSNDSLLFKRLLMSLEAIGLCRYILIRSSNSQGLHIYFPLPKPVSCYKFAVAMKQAVEQEGFAVKNGQLEIFPNVKIGRSLYKAHRLPLQTGSWVLNDDLQLIHNSIEQLVLGWREVASQQDIELLEQRIEAAKPTREFIRGSLREWKERLEATIKTGWTSNGQTDQILMELCIYARVFMGLEWDDVAAWMLKQVTIMPGYRQFCRHQKRIKRRIREWVTTNRKHNRYFPCRPQLKRTKAPSAASNDVRSKEALQRIKEAIEHILLENGKLPETVRAREKLICQTAKCSASTLRKHLELWHPNHQPQGYVTAEVERDTGVSLGCFNASASGNESSSKNSACVTAEPAVVSASSTEFLNNHPLTETPIRRSVTGDRQLSVYSSSVQDRKKERVEESKDKDKDQDQIKDQEEDQVFRSRSPLDVTNCKASGIATGRIVRRKTDGELFRVKSLNANGTFWACRVKQYVAWVDAVLQESEVEAV